MLFRLFLRWVFLGFPIGSFFGIFRAQQNFLGPKFDQKTPKIGLFLACFGQKWPFWGLKLPVTPPKLSKILLLTKKQLLEHIFISQNFKKCQKCHFWPIFELCPLKWPSRHAVGQVHKFSGRRPKIFLARSRSLLWGRFSSFLGHFIFGQNLASPNFCSTLAPFCSTVCHLW